MKSKFIKPFARYIKWRIASDAKNAISDQKRIFLSLISKSKKTTFGKDHNFESIETYEHYKKQVPIRSYEQLKEYIELIKAGQADILWPGHPKYFAKTSGTTSGIKYIPISHESISSHIKAARNATLNFAAITDSYHLFDGKLIFLSGSPTLTQTAGISTGRLSGIVNHEIPFWLKKNQVPSYATNCISDWETKLDKIVEETKDLDLRLISGIPPWIQMYFERLLAVTNKESILDIFPNLTLFAFGGVNYEPYKKAIEVLIGGEVQCLETYPASEGFIAFQDTMDSPGLLLNTNAMMYFEFVLLQNINDENPARLTLEEIELNKDYVILISSNAGLWSYNLGDTIRFVSKSPYRIIVSGRVKHFISAFGEHVISKEVEESIKITCNQTDSSIIEFTVAPQVNPMNGESPYHEWYIEFDKAPKDLKEFTKVLDQNMVKQNIYYQDLIEGKILQPLKIKTLPKGSFQQYMKSQGKLGGQNKAPRLSNDRKIALALEAYLQY